MIFSNFEIHATPFIDKATCKCGNYAKTVPNGWLRDLLYCPHCEIVYELKMIKVPDKKLSDEFMEQCRKFVEKNTRGM